MPQAIPSYEQMMPVVLQSTIRPRVGWAKTYLAKAGLIEKRIVLIDGARLAALMIEYGVGVTTRQTRTSKALDSDYFLED